MMVPHSGMRDYLSVDVSMGICLAYYRYPSILSMICKSLHRLSLPVTLGDGSWFMLQAGFK